MKYLLESNIDKTICPTGTDKQKYCRGETCSCFNWERKYEVEELEFESKFNWKWFYELFKEEKRQFDLWEPPSEYKGLPFVEKRSWGVSNYAFYKKRLPAEESTWYCGLNGDN